MKFKFCGDLDAPDWILREITVLSKISAIRVRVMVNQVLNYLNGKNIDYEKFSSNLNLSPSDIKGAITALEFIISNGIKYNVDDSILSNELQQLGLPKEHCDSLIKPFKENKDKLRENFQQKILKLPKLNSVDWRIDYLLSSSFIQELNNPSIQLKFTINNPIKKEPEIQTFEITSDKLRVLLYELKSAKEIMEGIS